MHHAGMLGTCIQNPICKIYITILYLKPTHKCDEQGTVPSVGKLSACVQVYTYYCTHTTGSKQIQAVDSCRSSHLLEQM